MHQEGSSLSRERISIEHYLLLYNESSFCIRFTLKIKSSDVQLSFIVNSKKASVLSKVLLEQQLYNIHSKSLEQMNGLSKT